MSRRVPQTLRARHREFKYFSRHLQYLQQNSDGSFSKIAVFTGPHRGPRPLTSNCFEDPLSLPCSRASDHLMSAEAEAAQAEAQLRSNWSITSKKNARTRQWTLRSSLLNSTPFLIRLALRPCTIEEASSFQSNIYFFFKIDI